MSNEGSDEQLDQLIHRADLDGLVRLIDDRCAAEEWSGLLRIRDRARRAVETGRQLWPAATLAEYRLALLAPPDLVAIVLDESDGLSGRFTIGPLTEVAAQDHTWADLSPYLERGPRAAVIAHERLLRGDALPDGLERDLPAVLEVPLRLASWEPDYPTAHYREVDAEFERPPLAADWIAVSPTGGAELLDDDDVDLAVRHLVEPWTESSNGRAETICVSGDAVDALGALGIRSARLAESSAEEALAWLAWAGASGGAHGRRRGAAAGRFGVWWLLGAIGQFERFPPTDSQITTLLRSLRWYRWDAFEPDVGWILQLAIEDVDDGTAWAIAARDAT